MKVCSVVLNWNGKEYISETIESLLRVQVPDGCRHEILVVDNNSTDDSVAFIKKSFPEVVITVNPTNLGYAAGNNRGIRYALKQTSDFVWIVNSDIVVASDSLSFFIAGAKKHPNSGIFGCKIYFYPGYEFYQNRYQDSEKGKVFWYAGGIIDWANVLASHRGVDEVDRGQLDYDLDTDYVTGAVMFIRSGLFSQIGQFDPDYCFYFEENDFCQRAVKAGSKLTFLFQPRAWHKNAQATGIGSPLQDYFLTRNRLLFAEKYAPLRSRLALLREANRLKKTGREWQVKAVRDYFSRKFGSGSFELS